MNDCCTSKGLITLETARNQLFAAIKPVSDTEVVSLEACLARVVTQPVVFPVNVPPHDNSAMNGYALALSDLKQHDTLSLAGQSLAGHPFSDPLPTGHCVRITTGATIPQRADTVIMQEHTEITSHECR